MRPGDRFKNLPRSADGLYRSQVFPGLWLDADALFAEDNDRLSAALERRMTTPEHAEFAAKLASAPKAVNEPK